MMRLSDFSKQVGCSPTTIKTTEKSAGIQPIRSVGGQRFYRVEDVKVYRRLIFTERPKE